MPYDQTTAIDHAYRASTKQPPAPRRLHQKHQDKVLKSTTSLNGKRLPNHYPSCPTITPLAQPLSLFANHYPSCPTIIPLCQPLPLFAQLFTPLCQPLSLLPNHYPSCPTIYPSLPNHYLTCPTITSLAQPLPHLPNHYPHSLRCHNQPFDFIKVSHLFCF